jgi:hypothetical protein
VVYIHKGLLFNYLKEQNYVICRKVDGTRNHHSKRNKADSERQHHRLSLICRIFLKKGMKVEGGLSGNRKGTSGKGEEG